MEYMISTATRTERTAPQQLTLLSDPTARQELTVSNAPVQFRLSKTTRQRGLAHVAQIRQQLAEAQARRAAAHTQPLPPSHTQAA
jgi:hypothetical protein